MLNAHQTSRLARFTLLTALLALPAAPSVAAQANPDYRYAYLPDDVDLSNPAKNAAYQQATLLEPGLGVAGAPDPVVLPATRVARKVGLAPISPAVVSPDDWAQLPVELQDLVTSGDPLAS